MATTKGAAKKKAPVTASDSEAASALPVFFKNPQILDSKRHGDTVMAVGDNYGFAGGTNSIPLNFVEFSEASKFYPIVFAGEKQVLPAAIMGLENDNYFVNSKGKWAEHYYIPAHARQYPFIFFEKPEEERFYLCVDEAAPQFNDKKAKVTEPLYEADGTPSPLSKNAMEFCTESYKQHLLTRAFCDDLVKYQLLTPYQSQANLNSGKVLHLSGFMMIDEAAFNGLTDVAYLDFRKKGWLPAIHFALGSVGNWKRLVDLAPQ